MAKVYVTKWAIARGIVLCQGEYTRRYDRQRRTLYRIDLKGHRNSPLYMVLGVDCFLTLEEAQKNTEEKFQKHLKECRDSLEAAQEGFILLNRGHLLVHEDPEDIFEVHAFGRALLPRS